MSKKNLVVIKNKKPLTTTLIIARELKRLHKNIIKIVNDYRKNFEKFGEIGDFENVQRHGKPTKFYYLNEPQLTFLIMMLRVKKNENDVVLKFKEDITAEFYRMRNLLNSQITQRANQEWLDTRAKGKTSRLKETDILNKFKDYAVSQGSNGYKDKNQVYITFTKMENNTLFVIDKLVVKDLKKKKQSIRDLLNINQLDEIKQADEIVIRALLDGMEKKMHYKDIYKLAKKRVELFAELKGKTLVPSIEFGYLRKV